MKQMKQAKQVGKAQRKEILKEDNGAALVIALMVLMVLAVMGIAVGSVTIGSHRLSDNNRDITSAYYIAEAGANMAYKELEREVWFAHENHNSESSNYFSYLSLIVQDLDGTVYTDFDAQFGENPRATISIETEVDSSVSYYYTIVSHAEIGENSRTVRMPVRVQWQKRGGGLPRLPDDAVMVVKNNLDIGNNVDIHGDVYLDEDVEKVKVGSNFKHYDSDGNLHKNDGGFIKTDLDFSLYEAILDSFPNNPETSTYSKSISGNTITENTHLSSLNVSSDLTFDTRTGSGSKEINLVVDDLDVRKDIRILGNGTVNIYVNKSLSFDNKVEINKGGAADKFNIFYAGTSTVEVKNNIDYDGTLFLNAAGIDFKNNVDMNGIVIAKGNVNFSNTADIVASIFAPESEVVISNNVNYTGTIVANTLNSKNNGNFTYALNQYLETYPYGPEPGSGSPGGSGEGTYTLDQLISAQPALEP